MIAGDQSEPARRVEKNNITSEVAAAKLAMASRRAVTVLNIVDTVMRRAQGKVW